MASKSLSTAELTQIKIALHKLARNIWWTWNQHAQELFAELSPRSWQNLYHNPVAVLHEVSTYELGVRLLEPEFAARAKQVLADFDAYMSQSDTWIRREMPELAGKTIAYFSAEFGLHETLPIAAGGLGVLAGDHAKSASDLGLNFVGISLFYREGYFQQAINRDNWQTEYYSVLDPKSLPIEPVLDPSGEPLVCSLRVGAGSIYFQAWRINVGRCVIYLLDTNRQENEPAIRDLTLRVYGGDANTRISQEMLLGIGGVRLLRALGKQPNVFHMNEGHAAFLTLELMREKLADGISLDQSIEQTRRECIFTTHTPVPAGHDRFPSDLVQYAAGTFIGKLKLTLPQFMAFGRVNPEDLSEPFCMTVLALKCSRAANGVSELHGQVSREMWQSMYPGKKVSEVPIGHVTNGIHLAGWMKGSVRRFWLDRLAIGNGGKHDRHEYELINQSEFWNQILSADTVSDEEIWALRYRLRRELIEFVRRRISTSEHRPNGGFIEYDTLLDSDALTIGFARRFATYKRAPLIFDQLENIHKLVQDSQRTVQFIFAGKAHPRDDEGKKFIQKIVHLSKYSDLKGRLVFVENYDIHVARQMVAGCDIWLNNPRRPLEASGTSGMKITAHGGLNCSILDGWWREGFDGTNGFSIGDDSHPENIEEQDRRDSANLFKVLSEEIIPSFYNRDADGIPHEWIGRIRRSMATLAPQYNTWRMVQEYCRKYYQAE